MDLLRPTNEIELPPPSSLVVAVAINGSRKSEFAVKWALEKFVPIGKNVFKLLYVRARILAVPTPMGNAPISKVRKDVAAAYKKELEWQANKMLLKFKQMCTGKNVDVEAVMIEADDVALAISREVASLAISELVIGASSSRMFTRKFTSQKMSSRISECAPSSCTVYIVSNGNVSSVRSSISDGSESTKDGSSDTSSPYGSSSSRNSSLQTDQCLGDFLSYNDPSLPSRTFQAVSTINKSHFHERPTVKLDKVLSLDNENKKDIRGPHSRNLDNFQSSGCSYERFVTDHSSWDFDQETTVDAPTNSPSSQFQEAPFRSFATKHLSWDFDQESTLDASASSPSSQSHDDVNSELDRLKIELKHMRGMYAAAQNDIINASQQAKRLSTRRMEEAVKLKEIHSMEEKARELARKEKEKHENVRREAELAMECVKREALKKKEAESKASRDAREKERLEKAINCPGMVYVEFTWEEIVSATSSFSDDLRIGKGAYGTVYKCSLLHVTAAVKVLHSKEAHMNKQFQQELEILSKMQHPHLLLLLGACIDHGCLVYEYMKNGSLEDRLFRRDNTPPIPWFERFRIAWEVASALLFLHNAEPKPIIHRDLKPANILLDRNFVSKLGDVGLSTSLPALNSTMSSIYGRSGPVGTLCYIDPEYQRSGVFSPKSDVYSFGMVILQLLTAKPILALTNSVETALSNGNLHEILDSGAGNWPMGPTQELANLGMSCVELSSKYRPDLENEVLPLLEKLKGIADNARNLVPCIQSAPPSHFICPLLQDVMENPYVASDGYTYERRAIEIWFRTSDKSPTTTLPFPHKTLTPNYTLLSAITEWKSKRL